MPVKFISGYGRSVADVFTHIGDPIRLCSSRYPIIGDPPSYGRSHFIIIASPDPSKMTCIGLPGGEGGSKKDN